MPAIALPTTRPAPASGEPVSSVPPTAAEAAATAASWERRGLLRRLVRIDQDSPRAA